MASNAFSEEDFACPVCFDVFKDPVLLPCTHSVCQTCLEQFWNSKGSRECPVCREISRNCDPPLNRHLKNLCEAFLKQRSREEAFCDEHKSEPLKLYCEEDKQLVCLVCRDSKLHKKHNCSPICEAAQEPKGELQLIRTQLQNKLDHFNATKLTFVHLAGHIKAETKQTENQIKHELENLHQFLRNEEATRMAALREEEQQKSQMIKEKIEHLDQDLAWLTDTIKTIEQMECDDVNLLQNYKNTLERAQGTPQDPEKLPQGALINVAKHLGNLKFRVWEKMKDLIQYTPVILDPNTAHPAFLLRQDLVGVKGKAPVPLPDNPERFSVRPAVLGSEGYTSGKHCWDVEVGQDVWSLGVAVESYQRKGKSSASNILQGLWVMSHLKYPYVYGIFSASQRTPVRVKRSPRKIRVQLDLDRSELTFSDPDNDTQLHTLSHAFTERVFPYFGGVSYKIVPLKPAVTLEQ